MTLEVRYSTTTACAVLLLSPLLALPYIILGIYRQQKSAFFLFALFLGFLAWLQLPFADLYRHTITALNYIDKPIEVVFKDSDFVTPLLSWLLVNNGIPYQFLRLFIVTESFYLMTIIFNYMIANSQYEYDRKEIFVRFWIMFLFFELVQTTSGVRYGFAVYQYVFALHLLINKRSYLSAALFAFLAIKIHTSFYFFVPISLLLYLCCRSRKRALIVLIILSSVAVFIIGKFSYLIGRRAEWYFAGGTSVSGNTFNGVTIYGFILFMLIRAFLIPFVYLVIKYFDPYSKWIRFAMVWLILLCVFITNGVMIFRMAVVFGAIGTFLLLDIESRIPLRNRFIQLVLWCGIMTTLFNTANYKTYVLNSRYQYIAMPTFVILDNQYDKAWIMHHIDNNRIKQEINQ